MKNITLYNGVEIPWVGYGTGVVLQYSRNPILFMKWRIRLFLSSVKHLKLNRLLRVDFGISKYLETAYSENYRLYDSGRIYGYSEVKIGNLVRKHGRDGLFLISKVSDMDVERKASPDSVNGNFELSLKYLNVDYLDMYLLHWPSGDWVNLYREMEKLYQEGKVKAIGVCNFNIENLEFLENECSIKPMVCQTECHPLNVKKELREYCRSKSIVMMAHTPTGRMCEQIRQNGVLIELAKKYNKTIAQIIIRWHYQNGVIPIVSTCSKAHLIENTIVDDFKLTPEEMIRIDAQDNEYIMLPFQGIDDPNYIYNL